MLKLCDFIKIDASRYRPLRSLPKIWIICLFLSLAAQISWHHIKSSTETHQTLLPSAPSANQLQLLAMGEPEVLSKLLMLWLQSFDNQPGLSLPLQALDYTKLISWLQQISTLDNRSHYALFSAAYIYAGVNDEAKQRQVFKFIEQQFKQQPSRYWRWLAHCSIMAKHRLHDNALALHYAKTLRLHTAAADVPAWARQMELGLLEESGEYESAKLLIGGLLSEDKITDPYELAFLNERLKALKNK